MGQNASVGTKIPTKSNFTIVDRIAKFLKLDDAGKLQKFFAREVKKLERAIDKLEANKRALKLTYENDLIDQSEVIEDAQINVENVYENIDMEAIKTNAGADAFAISYWNATNSAEELLDIAEEASKQITIRYKDAIEAIDLQISKRKNRMAKIK